jgi:hypothetical protein
MLREDHICEYCDAEYTVESEVEDIVSFCPYCGTEVTFGDSFEEFDEELEEDE